MTRIIYSLVSLLTLVMGVISYDHWRNAYNNPMSKSVDGQEETSWIPARHIRLSKKCTCRAEPGWLEFGATHQPRFLVTNKCSRQDDCVDYNMCADVPYTFNVSSLRDSDKFGNRYTIEEQNFCRNMWQTEAHTISVACVPVLPMGQR